jgi:fatty acid desaturase
MGAFAVKRPEHVGSLPEYRDLDKYQKMEYELFMLNYDINYRRELSEGLQGLQNPVKVLTSATNLMALMQRTSALLIYIVGVLVLITLVMWIIAFFFRFDEIKRSVLLNMFLTCLGLVCVLFIVNFMYDRTWDQIEVITLKIK